MMDETVARIRADFDAIAEYQESTWNHNTHYHNELLKHLPPDCERILEIGCGKGDLTRKLAEYAVHVTALDLSPNMLRKARKQSVHHHNITYVEADFMSYSAPFNSYDAIVSIATVHHLPLEQMFRKISTLLKPGGVLAILDLYEEKGVLDSLRSLFAVGVHRWYELTRNHGHRVSVEEQQAWDTHGQHDIYPPISSLQQFCVTTLPGATIKKHLLWRYSLIWQKPRHGEPE